MIAEEIQRHSLIFLAGISPGIFWLWVFVRNRRHRPRPRRLLILTFVAGGISTLPAAGIEWLLLGEDLVSEQVTFTAFAFAVFFVVGPVEEFCKFAAVRFGVFRSAYFDEPLDGLIYATAASLGFASVENVFYSLQLGPEVMIVRAPLSTLAHVVFGSIWGLGLSRAVAGRGTNWLILLTSLALAAALHGAFNAALFHPAGVVFAIALTGIGILVFVRILRRTSANSPYKMKRNVPRVECIYCPAIHRLGDRTCPGCNRSASVAAGNIHCSYCSTTNLAGSNYCSSCGDYFVAL